MTLDELLTTVPENVRQAIESVCDKAGTCDADWCILKAAGELIAIPELPPRLSREPGGGGVVCS